MNRITFSAVATALLALAGTGAHAGTIPISNTTEVAYYSNGSPYDNGGNYWGAPAIGGPTFYTPSGSVGWTNEGGGMAQVTIQFSTGFYSLTDPLGGGLTVSGADIFIKSGGGTSLPAAGTSTFYNYAIALGFDSGDCTGGKCGYTSAGLYQNATTAGAALTTASYMTSNQVWTSPPSSRSGYYYGGQYAPASAFAAGGACVSSLTTTKACSVAQDSPVVLLNNGDTSKVTGTSVTVTNNNSNSGAGAGTVDVVITGNSSVLAGIFSDFDIFWGTGDCSNAPIWGDVSDVVSVPEPSTLAILGSALGFVAWSRRRRRPSALPV